MSTQELIFAFCGIIFAVVLVWLNIKLERPDDENIWEEWWYDDDDEL